MEFVRYIELSHNNYKYYHYKDASNIEMNILGQFLFSEIRNDTQFFKEWLFDPEYTCIDGNTIELDKENGYIFFKRYIFARKKKMANSLSKEKIKVLLYHILRSLMDLRY